MFHLQAGVHFQEIEIAILIDDEFHRPGRAIFHLLGQRDRLFAHRLAGCLIQERGWGFFDHLLMASLDGTFPLPQIQAGALSIGQNLNFDMAGFFNEFFNEDTVVAKAAAPFIHGRYQTLPGLFIIMGDAHALAAAAGRGLQHHRIADVVRNPHRLFGVGNRLQESRHSADARGQSQLLGFDLVAHRLNRADRRADEGNALFLQPLCKALVFRQEAIARMHSLCARLLTGLNDVIDHQIAFRRRRRSDQHRFATQRQGRLHMQRLRIRLRIHRDRHDPHLMGRAHHPTGNFPAIGN